MYKKYTTEYVNKHFKEIGFKEEDIPHLESEYEFMWIDIDAYRLFTGDDVGILWEDPPCQYCPSQISKEGCKACDVYKDLIIKGGKK